MRARYSRQIPTPPNAAEETPTKKTAATRAAAKKAVAKKSAVKKAAAKKSAVKKSGAKRAVAKRAPSAKRPAATTLAETRPAPSSRPEPASDPALDDLYDLAPPEGQPVSGPFAGPGGDPYRRRPDTVVLTFEGPGPQRRLTVAFRIILAIPHVILVLLVTVVALVAAIVGWFAALVLGRLPGGLASFLGRYVQYATRVSAYTFYLLTDRYPPFSLTEPNYAVSVEVAPGQLNRATVFFRLILMIPAQIVVTLLRYGVQLAAVFVWLIVLVAGRMPTSLFEALAAVLRYETRLQAYFLLVTADYPSGLFGDPA